MGNCARFQSGGYIQLPGLASSFSEGITLQAWINPSSCRNNCRIFDLGRGKEQDNIFLSEYKDKKDLAFAIYQGKKRDERLVLRGAFQPKLWTHVTVTVDSAGNAKGYVNGKLQASVKMKAPAAAKDGMRTRCFVGRSNWGDDKSYDGLMAELRIWERVLSADEILDNYSRTLVGDEPGLLGYWPLSDFNTRGPVDLGRHQFHGAASKGVSDASASDLGSLLRTSRASVSISRQLLMDYIPLGAFPEDRPLCGLEATGTGSQRLANAQACGSYAPVPDEPEEETVVTCPVWEVTLQAPEQEQALSVTFDRDVDLVVPGDTGPLLQRQPAGEALRWQLPAEEVVRLRLPAGPQLDLPCATVRTDSGCTRLDFPSLGGLSAVTSDDLRQPSPQNPEASALPEDLDAATADAVTLYVRQLACATPTAKYDAPRSVAQSGGTEGALQVQALGFDWGDIADAGKKLIDDAISGGKKLVEDASELANRVGDALEDVGKALQKDLKNLQRETTFAVRQGQNLVLYTVDAAQDLIKRAPKVTRPSSAALIRRTLRQAKTLCVSSVNAAANVVEIVGEALDGSVFKVIVQGIEAAVAALRTFFERIGLAFRDLAAWLASLLKWLDFRKPLDTIHDWLLNQLDGLSATLAASANAIDDALAQAAGALDSAAHSPQRVRDLLPSRTKVKRSSELNFVLSHLENVMHTGFLPKSLAASLPALPQEPVDRIAQSLAALPLDKPLDLRCSELIGPLAAAWEELVDALRAGLRSAAQAGVAAVDWLRDFLTSRLKLPFFTALFEQVLFPGWKLTPLRLISLLAAIPAHLLGWKLDRLKDAKFTPVLLSGSAQGGEAQPRHAEASASASVASLRAAPLSSEGGAPKQGGNSARSGSDSDAAIQSAQVAVLVFQAIGWSVSSWENLRELRGWKKSQTDSVRLTALLISSAGAVGAVTAYTNLITAPLCMKGRPLALTTGGLVCDLIGSICRVIAGVNLWHEATLSKAEVTEIVIGGFDSVTGLLSFGLGVAGGVQDAQGHSREAQYVIGNMVLNGLMVALDGVSLLSYSGGTWAKGAAKIAAGGSLLCSTASLGLAAAAAGT
ncbi:MAG: hypothetical protein IRY87_01790 [Acetobacteraceae bacterium]|nr:hypothetical protein [Acetobacteraceae bacterium]